MDTTGKSITKLVEQVINDIINPYEIQWYNSALTTIMGEQEYLNFTYYGCVVAERGYNPYYVYVTYPNLFLYVPGSGNTLNEYELPYEIVDIVEFEPTRLKQTIHKDLVDNYSLRNST